MTKMIIQHLAQSLARSGVMRFSRKTKTATFNGRHILINKPWFNRLNKAQRIAVIEHEILHYCYRTGGKS